MCAHRKGEAGRKLESPSQGQGSFSLRDTTLASSSVRSGDKHIAITFSSELIASGKVLWGQFFLSFRAKVPSPGSSQDEGEQQRKTSINMASLELYLEEGLGEGREVCTIHLSW